MKRTGEMQKRETLKCGLWGASEGVFFFVIIVYMCKKM